MPDTHIIDLSHWNTVTSFYSVRNSGVIGIIHKATEGTSYADPDYAPRMADALECGLLWGAYHFLKHASILEQMEHFVRTARLPPGSRACIDHEDSACRIDELREAVLTLHGLDETLQISVYSGHLIKEQLNDEYDPVLSKTSLWLAQYTTGEVSWPTGTWKHWSLHQFTDTGSCPGIEGACDLNRFNGSKQQAALWMGPAATVQPEAKPQTVLINVERGVRVVLNGVEYVAS